MSNQIIYSAVYLPNIRFRYGLQNKSVTCRKTSYGFFFCPKRVTPVSTDSNFALKSLPLANHIDAITQLSDFKRTMFA